MADFPDNAILNTVNQQLQTQFWELSQSAFECLSTQYITTQVGTGWTGFAEQSVSVLYTSKNLLVYEQSIHAYCGNAHPSIFTEQTAIDMTTAKELDWHKIFIFDKIYGDKTDKCFNIATRADFMADYLTFFLRG